MSEADRLQAVAKALKQAVRGSPVSDEEWEVLPERRKEAWLKEAQAAIDADAAWREKQGCTDPSSLQAERECIAIELAEHHGPT